jgi:hypothetical protein
VVGDTRQRIEVEHRQRCPLCREGFDAAFARAQCQGCQTVYHSNCARELGGCSTMGCERRGQRPRGEIREEVLRSRDRFAAGRRRLRLVLGCALVFLGVLPLLILLVHAALWATVGHGLPGPHDLAVLLILTFPLDLALVAAGAAFLRPGND